MITRARNFRVTRYCGWLTCTEGTPRRNSAGSLGRDTGNLRSNGEFRGVRGTHFDKWRSQCQPQPRKLTIVSYTCMVWRWSIYIARNLSKSSHRKIVRDISLGFNYHPRIPAVRARKKRPSLYVTSRDGIECLASRFERLIRVYIRVCDGWSDDSNEESREINLIEGNNSRRQRSVMEILSKI